MTVSARSLERSFGDEVAVDNVSLDFHPGEIHAIVGLNGAGKTTLMRLLLGMLRPDSGTATINGTGVGAMSGEEWSLVGYLIETPFAYSELNVRENLVVAAGLRGLRSDQIGEAVTRSISRFDLGRWESRRAGQLSLGNRQRLGLAAATIHQPSVMILDEPANGLDPAGVVFVRDWLRDAAAEGACVLLSSHHFDELARVADRITVMHRGRVVGDLDPHVADLEHRFFELALQADIEMGAAR